MCTSLKQLALSAIISSVFIMISGCLSVPFDERINPSVPPITKGGLGGIVPQNLNNASKHELVSAAEELWREYHCVTISDESINREFAKWEGFVKEIIKSDYSGNGDKKSVSLIRKINENPLKAKEGGYYDDYENTIVIPYKATFPTGELKEELLYALLDRKLETLSRIERTRRAKTMKEYRALSKRINPEHVDKFGDNFDEYSVDELGILITYMDEKYQAEVASIEYNLHFFQDALDHELGHFFLDDVEEGGLGLFYDERYVGPEPEEILDYVYNRFNGSSLKNRLEEIYTPVTWCHTLEGYNIESHPPKGLTPELKELIEYLLSLRASYKLYEIADYGSGGIEWHVGTLSFLGIGEDEIPLTLTLPFEGGGEGGGELPPYFVPHKGKIFFNRVRKEIIEEGNFSIKEIRQAEVYLRVYEAILLRHELFVRMIDALMSVSLEDNSEVRDFYNTRHDLKPVLNESDLKMFARMKFIDKPMFQKGIEKYRLALQLLKSGHTPQEIRKTLEYATHYVYNGREYFWLENGFKIIGEIPSNKHQKTNKLQ